MTTTIIRCWLQGAPLRPGFWRWGFVGSRAIPIVACPSCGERRCLEIKRHQIDETGFVAPYVACPDTSCGFDDQISLDGYRPPERMAS